MKNLQNVFERQAAKNMSLHPTAKEYSPLLVLSVIGKVLTMLLSVTGGILYFTGIFKGIYLPIVVFLSASLLILLEGLNLFTLSKALKMALRGKPVPSAILSLFSLLLFAISFFITTEGVRVWKAERTTQKAEITRDFKQERETIQKDYKGRIKMLQQAIEPLKQYAWKSKQVAQYNIKIDSLEKVLAGHVLNLAQAEKQAQEQNLKNTDTQAEYYWLLGVGLMIFQLIFNVVIAVLYNKIHRETQQTQRIDEELNTLRENRLNTFYNQVKTDFATLENLFFQRMALAGSPTALALSPIIEKPEQPTPEKKEEPQAKNEDVPEVKKETKRIGFQIIKPNDNRLDDNRNNENRLNDYRYKETEVPEETSNEELKYTRICPNCNKGFVHKHHKQKYCCSECRVEFWEKKTGKKLNFKRNQ